MKKALFWDFHGTLVLPDSVWALALHEALVFCGCEGHFDVVRAHLRKGYTWNAPEIAYTDGTGERWWADLFSHLDILYEQYGVPREMEPEVNTRFRSIILDSSRYTLYEGAKQTLLTCMDMGYENHILSNNFPELESVIDGLGLSGLFKSCTVSANIGYEKPHPEIFAHAMCASGHPALCIMVGDNPIADVQGGKNAGMKTILVHTPGIWGADRHCKTLLEIPAALAGPF